MFAFQYRSDMFLVETNKPIFSWRHFQKQFVFSKCLYVFQIWLKFVSDCQGIAGWGVGLSPWRQTITWASADQVPWWRHQMETFSALLALCAGNSPVTGEFPAQRPVTRSFDAFFDLHLNKRLSKQPWGWWFETPSWSLWRQCSTMMLFGFAWPQWVNGHTRFPKLAYLIHSRVITLTREWIRKPMIWTYYLDFPQCHPCSASRNLRVWQSIGRPFKWTH